VIVVGAGISGLACAYALKKRKVDVAVLESGDSPGGIIRSVKENSYLFETGPQSFSTTPQLNALIADLGLTNEFITAPAKAPRYILVNGELRSVPLSPPALLTSSLLSWSTKFSLLREPFRKTIPSRDDESIATFVRRKFTDELLELLVGPFVSGIYAGDPEKLSLRAAFPQLHEAEEKTGSIIRGMKAAAKAKSGQRQQPTLASFRAGNETLPLALSKSLGDSLQMGVRVTQINRHSPGEYEIFATTESGPVQFRTSHLVLATPAHVAALLVEPFLLGNSAILAQVEYAPVAVVSLGYRRASVTHSLNGFGFLIPRSSNLKTLGSVWNSSIFPNRAPQDHVLLTSFVGGATDPATVAPSTVELTSLVHRELTPILGLSAEPVSSRVSKYRHAIPQYTIGHAHRIAALKTILSGISGLHVVGNYLPGPSIGACVEYAQSVAESIRIG